MPDYVYALHDFLPEHDDEVSFLQGERIEIIEKDDMYSDGWWQGRNLAGKVGLFPESYTTAAPPSTFVPSSALTDAQKSQTSSTPLHEVSETSSANEQPAAHGSGHTRQPSQGDEVMKATMTDVQKAIEQLGRHNVNSVRDDRSFSFTSTKTGDGDTDTDIDIDSDHEANAAGDDWHRDARVKLAEKARKVVAAQQKKEQEEEEIVRSIAPPIEVEVSDESEGEDDDDDDGHHHRMREHPHIPEEDEDEGGETQAAQARHTAPDAHDEATSHGSQPPSAAANRTTFPNIQPVMESSAARTKHISATSLPTPTSPASSSHAIPSPEPNNNRTGSPSLSVPAKTPPQTSPTSSTVRDTHVALPSPAASTAGQQHTPRHTSLTSSGQVSHTLQLSTPEQTPQRKVLIHPSEWTVEEVVDWLRSKGFGDDVCERFIEQEITGDVLLDLDVSLLKSELGIPAFGKRMRISNFISDLRRPPSVAYSDHGQSQSQSISQSQSQPHTFFHTHSQSIQSSAHTSLNSPFYPNGFSPQGVPSSGYGSILSAESPLHTGDLPGTPLSPSGRDAHRASDPISNPWPSVGIIDMSVSDRANEIRAMTERPAMVGLGVGVPGAFAGGQKNRPAQLMLSPSDSNLIGSKTISGDIPEETDEERAVVSDNEGASSANKRRRMFTPSIESGSSAKLESAMRKNSKEGPSATPSPQSNGLQSSDNPVAIPRHGRRQKSIDGNKSPDRLSLFGNAFNGSIGKSRKPAPRYSFADHDTPLEKPSTMNLSRLYGGRHKKASTRPITADGLPSREEENKEKLNITPNSANESKDERDSPTVLRKRTSSNDNIPVRGMQVLKPGQSVLQQIGEPDHKGWMRKKGDRYNSWKSRYFVLQGPHLYILKSDDNAEIKIKGYINIFGYKVLADENTDPGRYGFRIIHDTDKTHFFSSAEQIVIREWMKAIMKATIGRDYSKPVVSSCNIPTIPLTVAQAMSPAPRPPSPTARAATQKAHRKDNPNQLTSRDARVLMGLPSVEDEDGRLKLDGFFDTQSSANDAKSRSLKSPISPNSPKSPAPQRPPREIRNGSISSELTGTVDASLIEWANSHLPKTHQIIDPYGPLCGGLALLRLAESIRGKPCSPPVLDSAFPSESNDDKLDGLFKLFDFLLDNDVKTGSVSINEVRMGQRDKIIQLLRALKAWDDRRKAIELSIAKGGPSLSYWVHV